MTKESVRQDIRDIIESKFDDFSLMTYSLENYIHENLGEYLQSLGVELDCIKIDNIYVPNASTFGSYALTLNVVYIQNSRLQSDEIADFQEKFISTDMMRIYTIKTIIT